MNLNLPDFFKDPHVLAGKESGEPILIGLSGGADSSALLQLLCLLREKYFFPLYAAHVNHGIRTDEYSNEAFRDEEFCKKLCERLGVKLFSARVDVPSLAKNNGSSLETAARDARYGFFADIMLENGISILATAHNADDNLETQIFNLCRGCGIDGICGIPEVRRFDRTGGIIVRPILSASKREIIEYCEINAISYVTDSTNFENDCTRNRIRNIIIPELNSIFSSPQRSALRLSKAAREELDFISRCANDFLKDDPYIDVSELLKLHRAVAKRALIIAFEAKSGNKPEEVHINSLLSLANAQKDGYIALPAGYWAVFEKGKLSFVPSLPPSKESHTYDLPLHEGLNMIGGTPYAVIVTRNTEANDTISIEKNTYLLYSKARLYCSDLSALSAKSRREGDTVLTQGMHKKVKKLFCDKKIPREHRDMPIIFEGNDPIYVPLCAVSDRALPKNGGELLSFFIYLKK